MPYGMSHIKSNQYLITCILVWILAISSCLNTAIALHCKFCLDSISTLVYTQINEVIDTHSYHHANTKEDHIPLNLSFNCNEMLSCSLSCGDISAISSFTSITSNDVLQSKLSQVFTTKYSSPLDFIFRPPITLV